MLYLGNIIMLMCYILQYVSYSAWQVHGRLVDTGMGCPGCHATHGRTRAGEEYSGHRRGDPRRGVQRTPERGPKERSTVDTGEGTPGEELRGEGNYKR